MVPLAVAFPEAAEASVREVTVSALEVEDMGVKGDRGRKCKLE